MMRERERERETEGKDALIIENPSFAIVRDGIARNIEERATIFVFRARIMSVEE
jgi:hypothetical protein